VRTIRQAISPRFAIKTFRIGRSDPQPREHGAIRLVLHSRAAFAWDTGVFTAFGLDLRHPAFSDRRHMTAMDLTPRRLSVPGTPACASP
jgi:hypothetical protein